MTDRKILYTGDTSLRVELEVKGAEAITSVDRWIDNSVYLAGALRDKGWDVNHMPPHLAFHNFPRTAEELAEYDLVVLSDIGHDTLALYPGQERFEVQTNRMEEIAKYVRAGGGLLYCGGYFTFQGKYGHGRWFETPVADVLPIEIRPVPDDRVEAMQGLQATIVTTEHPVMAGLDWDSFPPLLGYNKAGGVQGGGEILATIGNGDPFIAVREVGKGRVVAVSTDPAPHWGTYFCKWTSYAQFWNQVATWASGGNPTHH